MSKMPRQTRKEVETYYKLVEDGYELHDWFPYAHVTVMRKRHASGIHYVSINKRGNIIEGIINK